MDIMINDAKRRRAERAVERPESYDMDSAERTLYNKAVAEDVKEVVQYIYVGLGGELVTEEKAERVTTARAKISKKNAKK